MPQRSQLLRATARSEEILSQLPPHFLDRDRAAVPALVFVRPGTGDDNDTRNALVLLEQIDGAIEVRPPLVGSIDATHEITLTTTGRAWVRELAARRTATPEAA